MVTMRSSRSSSIWKRATLPSVARAPFCMRLLISRKCQPSRVGISEERNANPLMSPFTLIWPRAPQSLAESKGTRIMIQRRGERRRSSLASKRFWARAGLALEGFGIRGNRRLHSNMNERAQRHCRQELNCREQHTENYRDLPEVRRGQLGQFPFLRTVRDVAGN